MAASLLGAPTRERGWRKEKPSKGIDEVEYGDGSREVLNTFDSWRVTRGA